MLCAQRAHMGLEPCAALLDRVDGDVEIFTQLCDLFLEDAPKRLELIRSAFGAADARTVAREAHAYKGAASAFDADEVVSAARQLEHVAASGDLRAAQHLLEALETHSRTLIDAVRAGRELV
jgi:HPt (histidine-containing phosphotransfer) domain-containing protein